MQSTSSVCTPGRLPQFHHCNEHSIVWDDTQCHLDDSMQRWEQEKQTSKTPKWPGLEKTPTKLIAITNWSAVAKIRKQRSQWHMFSSTQCVPHLMQLQDTVVVNGAQSKLFMDILTPVLNYLVGAYLELIATQNEAYRELLTKSKPSVKITSTWKVPYSPLVYCILNKIMFHY